MPQRFLSIKNFEKYQSYKHRNPPWFKIHKSMFGDREFVKLSSSSRFLYVGLIYLAVETENKVYNDPTWIAQRLYIDRTEVNLTPLYRAGFLQTSNVRRECSVTVQLQDSTVQSAVAVSNGVGFEVFWEAYPRKEKKVEAERAWKRLHPDPSLITLLLARLEEHKASDQWTKEAGKYIPHPSTWLNQKRWEDQLRHANGACHKPPPPPPKTHVIERGLWKQTYGDPRQYGYD